jgi:hypothetical protein
VSNADLSIWLLLLDGEASRSCSGKLGGGRVLADLPWIGSVHPVLQFMVEQVERPTPVIAVHTYISIRKVKGSGEKGRIYRTVDESAESAY